MVKGKFVGKVNISLEIPNDYPDLISYDSLKEDWDAIAEHMKEFLQDEIGEEFAVSVETLESELTRTDD